MLEKEIFEEMKDIFYDASIVRADNFSKILDDNYITPHKEQLKNPIPLRFVKIRPNVTFKFDLELKDGIITKDEKLLLFIKILINLGVGAKTNVGYGKFEDNIIEKMEKIALNKRIENSDNVVGKCKALIEKSKKVGDDLFKKLRNEEMTDSDKKEIKEAFLTKYPNESGKWVDKTMKLFK